MLDIELQVIPPSIEDSHLITFPVCPASVIVPAFTPEQTTAFEEVVPPTETGFTVMVAADEATVVQPPLRITA